MAKNIDDVIRYDSGGDRPSRGGYGWVIKLALILLVIGAGYLLCRQYANRLSSRTDPQPAQTKSADQSEAAVLKALAQGEYGQAWRKIERHQLAGLAETLQNELVVPFYFKYDLPAAAPMRNDRLQLPIKTPYYIILDPGESCYIYLLQCNSAGEWRQLFPNDQYADGENPYSSGEIYIPKYGRFLNETGPGKETLYLLASRWRQEKLENLIQKVVHSSTEEKQILDYINNSLEAKHEFHGVVCKKYEFDHE